MYIYMHKYVDNAIYLCYGVLVFNYKVNKMTLLHDIVVKDSKETIDIGMFDSYPLEIIRKTLLLQYSIELSEDIELNDRILSLSKQRLVSHVYKDVNIELYILRESIFSLCSLLMTSKDYYRYEELITDIYDKLESIDQITHGKK